MSEAKPRTLDAIFDEMASEFGDDIWLGFRNEIAQLVAAERRQAKREERERLIRIADGMLETAEWNGNQQRHDALVDLRSWLERLSDDEETKACP